MKSLVLAVALAVSGATYADDSRIADAVKMFPATPGYGYVMEDGEWEWKGSPSTFNAIELTEASKQHKYVHTVENKHYGWSGKYFWVFLNGKFYSIERSLIDGNNVADSIKDILTDRMVSEYTANISAQVEEAESVAAMVQPLVQAGVPHDQVAKIVSELMDANVTIASQEITINALTDHINETIHEVNAELSETAPSFVYDYDVSVANNVFRAIEEINSNWYTNWSNALKAGRATQAQLDEAHATISELTANLESSAADLASAQADLEEANAKVSALESELETYKEYTANALEAKDIAIANLEQRLLEEQSVIFAQRARIAELEADVASAISPQQLRQAVATAGTYGYNQAAEAVRQKGAHSGVVVEITETAEGGLYVSSVSLSTNNGEFDTAQELYNSAEAFGYANGLAAGLAMGSTTIEFDGNAKAERLSYVQAYTISYNGTETRVPATSVDIDNLAPGVSIVDTHVGSFTLSEYANLKSQNYSLELSSGLQGLSNSIQNEIKGLIEEAYADGYEDGYNDGYDDGYSDGYSAGYDQGFEDGVNSVQ